MGPMTTTRIGPMRRDFGGAKTPGDCQDCGGQCSPACGEDPLGCVYGGVTVDRAFWLIADGCELYHGEPDA